MSAVRLSELLGLPGPAAFLRGVVAGGRYANAYLFTGPAGVGKGTAALAFARALLCETRNRANGPPGLFDAPAEPPPKARPRRPPLRRGTSPRWMCSPRWRRPTRRPLPASRDGASSSGCGHCSGSPPLRSRPG